MFSGGQSSENVSLLPDNPGARIEGVQGGGGLHKTNGMKWTSEPIRLADVREFNLSMNPGSLKKYQTRWRQTLGPSIPSRRKPRQDPHIIVGSLNALECPTYIAAPLRGDQIAASTVFAWTDELLASSPKSHVVFLGPLSGKEPSKSIETGLISLLTKYPGHVIHISEKESNLPSLDGLLLNALPETSKQVALGFIPEHENVYHRSTRDLDCLTVDTLKIPFSKIGESEKGDSLNPLEFIEPTRTEERDKDFDAKDLSNGYVSKAIPGWVTKISFRSTHKEQEGGAEDEIEVRLGVNGPYKIRKNAKAAWEKGDFTAQEKALLEHEGLQYSAPVYAKFFEGLVNNQCGSEAATQLSPDCGIFRYIMADRYYRQVKAVADGKQVLKVGDDVMPGHPGPSKSSLPVKSSSSPDAPGTPDAQSELGSGSGSNDLDTGSGSGLANNSSNLGSGSGLANNSSNLGSGSASNNLGSGSGSTNSSNLGSGSASSNLGSGSGSNNSSNLGSGSASSNSGSGSGSNIGSGSSSNIGSGSGSEDYARNIAEQARIKELSNAEEINRAAAQERSKNLAAAKKKKNDAISKYNKLLRNARTARAKASSSQAKAVRLAGYAAAKPDDAKKAADAEEAKKNATETGDLAIEAERLIEPAKVEMDLANKEYADLNPTRGGTRRKSRLNVKTMKLRFIF